MVKRVRSKKVDDDLEAVAARLAQASSVCPVWTNDAAVDIAGKGHTLIMHILHHWRTLKFG